MSELPIDPWYDRPAGDIYVYSDGTTGQGKLAMPDTTTLSPDDPCPSEGDSEREHHGSTDASSVGMNESA